VVFENRPFAITQPATTPNAPASPLLSYLVDGETVVEAIYGHSGNLNGSPGYANGADRTILLRWYASQPDPVVRSGGWIADVTYERSQNVVISRWWAGTSSGSSLIPDTPLGVANINNNGEWDNLPAQRCIWYQIQKVQQAESDPYNISGGPYRSMVVYVNQSLQARTLLTSAGTPVVINAALIAPSVINVIPQTVFVR
jgi:hypothetical protein